MSFVVVSGEGNSTFTISVYNQIKVETRLGPSSSNLCSHDVHACTFFLYIKTTPEQFPVNGVKSLYFDEVMQITVDQTTLHMFEAERG